MAGPDWLNSMLAEAQAQHGEPEPVLIITDDMSRLEVALALARAGIYVFPVDHPESPQCAGIGVVMIPRRVRSAESIPASGGVRMRRRRCFALLQRLRDIDTCDRRGLGLHSIVTIRDRTADKTP